MAIGVAIFFIALGLAVLIFTGNFFISAREKKLLAEYKDGARCGIKPSVEMKYAFHNYLLIRFSYGSIVLGVALLAATIVWEVV